MSKCQHKNIIVTEKSYYRELGKGGYYNSVEKEDMDLGKYFIESEQVSVVCEDCGEDLE